MKLKASKLDKLAAEFINQLYQEGEPISYAGHLLSALKRFVPPLRLALPTSSQYYRNWQRSYVPCRAVPASWELVEAMIGCALSQGNKTLAALLGLGFNCFLRTAEMLQLTHAHLLFHKEDATLSVALATSKTSHGNCQVLLVEDPILFSLVRSIYCPGKSQQFLWEDSGQAFREAFASLLREMGFPKGSYHPYSLRRGGATWHFGRFHNLDSTVARGRWACPKTAKIYVDSGTLQLAELSWTPLQRKAVNLWRQKGARLLMRLRQKWKRRVLRPCDFQVFLLRMGYWGSLALRIPFPLKGRCCFSYQPCVELVDSFLYDSGFFSPNKLGWLEPQFVTT